MDTIDLVDITIDAVPGWGTESGIKVDMLRLDKIHPLVSGNKWFKLHPAIDAAKAAGYGHLLSFGGAHSNHLLALAAAAHGAGFRSTGLVRGHHGAAKPTETLKYCMQKGMHLHFLDRQVYRRKTEPSFLDGVQKQYPDAWVIPEGGADAYGRKGSEQIAAHIPDGYTHVCCAIGTGTMFAGLRNALPASVYMLGFIPMKGGKYIDASIVSYLRNGRNDCWQTWDRWHFGGFGKSNPDLRRFVSGFYDRSGIPLDLVYTGKMMAGVRELLDQQFFPSSAKILCIHSGGLRPVV